MAEINYELFHAVSAKDDALVWHLCANGDYSELAYSNPRSIIEEVLKCTHVATDDALVAIGTCLLEHMLEVDFEYIITIIKNELEKPNIGMARCMSMCAKFGQSRLPMNSDRFDEVRDKAWTIYREAKIT